jgi:hypothetical protein
MRWHKEGVREDDRVMVHLSDDDAWKALDSFDADFARDARNVRIGLVTNGFDPFSTNFAPYSCWHVFAIPYNLSIVFSRSMSLCSFASLYLV